MIIKMEAFVAAIVVASLVITAASSRIAEPRIVGGHDALPGDYPFFVHWSGCGASLIWKDVLLTAAHCDRLPNNQVRVSADHRRQGGTTSIQDDDTAISRTISERRVHPQWNEENYQYDFMVLKLNQPVEDVLPIRLNDNAQIPVANSQVTAIGLGGNDAKSYFLDPLFIDSKPISIEKPPVDDEQLEERNFDPFFLPRAASDQPLQEVQVSTFSHSVCNGQQMYRGHIDEATMFCAGLEQGGRDACSGDSGGPLLLNDDDGRYLQVGVISFGSGCARENRPGIYARVSVVYEWIQEQICDLSDSPPSSCLAQDPQPEYQQVKPIDTVETQTPEATTVSTEEQVPLLLDLCEEDCSSDDECSGELICFRYEDSTNQHRGDPHCSGRDDYGRTFCTHADPSDRADEEDLPSSGTSTFLQSRSLRCILAFYAAGIGFL